MATRSLFVGVAVSPSLCIHASSVRPKTELTFRSVAADNGDGQADGRAGGRVSSSGTISRRPTLPLPLPSSLPFPPFFAFSHIPLSRHKPPLLTNDVTLRCGAVIDKGDILICDKATDRPTGRVRGSPACPSMLFAVALSRSPTSPRR